MARLGHGLEELLESRGAADIFGRSAPFAIDEARVVCARNGGCDLLDLDTMSPIIPEIIGVGEASDAALDELVDAHTGSVAGADHESIVIIEADAIGSIADVEAEQMIVFEEHAGLDREMQGLEAVGDGKFDTAPDGGLHVFERDANPGDLIGHIAALASLAEWIDASRRRRIRTLGLERGEGDTAPPFGIAALSPLRFDRARFRVSSVPVTIGWRAVARFYPPASASRVAIRAEQIS